MSNRLQNISSHITPSTFTPTSTTIATTTTTTNMSTPPPKPPITCHVLDTSIGRPASSIPVHLYRLSSASTPNAESTFNTTGTTNSDGRIVSWSDNFETKDGEIYKLRFDTLEYFKGETFFPVVEVTFVVKKSKGDEHYHVPVLLSPYSYSTYRGS